MTLPGMVYACVYSFAMTLPGNFEVSPKVVFVQVCLVFSNLLVRTFFTVVAAFQSQTVAGKSVLLRNGNRINPNQLW